MKVILLETIKGLGKKYDVKIVKDGYARNFLLPRGLAKIAAEKTIKELEAKKIIWEKEEQATREKLEILAKDLNNKEFKFALKTGKPSNVQRDASLGKKKEVIFGSISKNEIKKAVLASISRFPVSEDDIEIKFEHPIKTLGEHSVEIDFGKGVKTRIKVIAEADK
jgi:large subunit ribosomal protein L9